MNAYQVNFRCPKCNRPYVYHDSMERHMRDKHGTTWQRAEAKRRREAEKRDRRTMVRAAKHRELCFNVVKEALAWSRFPPNMNETIKALQKACAALEKFETGK